MLEQLLEALQQLKNECKSRPEGTNACNNCPYAEFCHKDCSVFKDLPQNFDHPLLNT